MKNQSLLLLSLIILLASCSNATQQSAQNAGGAMGDRAADSIKVFLSKIVIKPYNCNSATVLTFNKTMTDYRTPEYYKYLEWANLGETIREREMASDKKLYKKHVAEGYYDKIKVIGLQKTDSIKKAFTPHLSGYSAQVDYDYYSNTGLLKKASGLFLLDTNLKVLKKVIPVL